MLQPVDQTNTYYGKTAKVIGKATDKISKIGGFVSGAVWAGATYITGGTDESEDGGSNK